MPTEAITTAHAVLAVGERTYSGIGDVLSSGEYILLDMDQWNFDIMELAGVIDGSDNDANILEFYAARSANDSFHHIAQATFTCGTQPQNSSLYYADTVAVSVKDRAFQMVPVQNGNNQRARLMMDAAGYRYILIVASTLASTSIKLHFATRRDWPDGLIQSWSLDGNSSAGGTQKLTIASNVAVGTAQECKSCLVKWSGTGPVTMNIGATADADDYPLDSTATPVAIENLDQLNFYSGTDGDIVNILWRN